MSFRIFFNDVRLVFMKDELGLEIARIALPAAIAITADPIASLIDTAFIGHIGPVELAAVGVSIALFNQISRITIFPLVSITTSFVAEEDTASRLNDENESYNLENALPKSIEMRDLDSGETEQLLKDNEEKTILINNSKRHISSASSALVIGCYLGLFQAILLIFAGKPLLGFMGIKDDSPMLSPALQYLTLRSLGSPAILLSLAMQGIFRGFKDTKTPLYATLPLLTTILFYLVYIVAGDVTNIILDPIFIFVFNWGVKGAAFAHILSQYLISVILLWRLRKRIHLLPPRVSELQLGRFLKNGSLLLARVIAVTFCVTLSVSMAARLGPIPMAAFQISLQIWLATSLLADGLAVAGQAILASSFAEKDHEKAKSTAARVLQHSLILGLLLSLILGVGLQFGSRLFTEDIRVLHLISISIPFVAATQPINSLAFVFDGINFGASDFAYSALSMVLVSIVSILCLFILFNTLGFIGIWVSLTIYMSLRMFAGFLRIGTGSGPWCFLRS